MLFFISSTADADISKCYFCIVHTHAYNVLLLCFFLRNILLQRNYTSFALIPDVELSHSSWK